MFTSDFVFLAKYLKYTYYPHSVSFEAHILFISEKNVIFLSGDNAIRDQWTCAAQSLLSSFVNVENILRLCRKT